MSGISDVPRFGARMFIQIDPSLNNLSEISDLNINVVPNDPDLVKNALVGKFDDQIQIGGTSNPLQKFRLNDNGTQENPSLIQQIANYITDMGVCIKKNPDKDPNDCLEENRGKITNLVKSLWGNTLEKLPIERNKEALQEVFNRFDFDNLSFESFPRKLGKPELGESSSDVPKSFRVIVPLKQSSDTYYHDDDEAMSCVSRTSFNNGMPPAMISANNNSSLNTMPSEPSDIFQLKKVSNG